MLQLQLPKYKSIEVITKSSSEYISFSQGTVKIHGTPAPIKAYIQERLQSSDYDFYQDVRGIYPLRKKIAEKLSIKFAMPFSPENIMISHGAIGGITAICLTLLKAGDEVIVPEPAYPSYRNIILFSKAIPVYTQGYFRSKDNWRFDFENIKRSITTRTRMIIISNPSNPTGMCLSHEDLKALKHLCEERGIYLVADEVYDNYIYDGAFNSFSPEVLNSDFVIRTGSFSKDYAMSGWRIGYVLAAQSLIPHFTAVQDGTLCCPSVIGQHAALFALEHEELISEQTGTVKNNCNLACRLLQPLVERGVFSLIKPQAGIFLFLKTAFEDSEALVMDILNTAKVALVPGKDFGPSAESRSSIRLCFARQESVVEEGINRMLDYFID